MLSGPRTCYRTSRAQKTRRVLVRGSGSTMNRHTHTQPQKRAARDKRGPRAPHTHCRQPTSATRRPAREERTAHTQFKFECDRAPSECAGPGSRRGRRHGLQHDGDGAASRRRYGGGRVYMELTIDGLARRPAQRGSFDIKGPRPGCVCNTASIIRDARAPRNNPRAGTTRGTTSSHLGILGSTEPHLVGPLGHRLAASGLTIGI